jgi:hypothetical protein
VRNVATDLEENLVPLSQLLGEDRRPMVPFWGRYHGEEIYVRAVLERTIVFSRTDNVFEERAVAPLRMIEADPGRVDMRSVLPAKKGWFRIPKAKEPTREKMVQSNTEEAQLAEIISLPVLMMPTSSQLKRLFEEIRSHPDLRQLTPELRRTQLRLRRCLAR